MNEGATGGLEPFLRNLMWVLGSLWVVIQIAKSFKRSPPVSQEIETKISTHKTEVAGRLEKFDTRLTTLEKDDRVGRSVIYNKIEALRTDMDDGLRDLGERAARQEAQGEMINQRQVQMDGKIDTLLKR